MVTGEDDLSAVLVELDSIANAAMTEAEREMRALPVLADSGLSPEALCEAISKEDLPWNRQKASAFGVSAAAWQQALTVAGLKECNSLADVLRMIHRAESAAAMLRAGYQAQRGADGALRWTR